jgi:hypothetical protein
MLKPDTGLDVFLFIWSSDGWVAWLFDLIMGKSTRLQELCKYLFSEPREP